MGKQIPLKTRPAYLLKLLEMIKETLYQID